MPSSVTLTVSHLPTSTAFFLSALQPLNYAYRGRSNNTIGFGSTTNPSAPPDFWITQEIPGVPAGAAHVAFQAPSRTAVQYFFTAALKAGGNIHGEPAVRDSSGYYSAAVIDFDGNSIEAVFRPSFSDNKENDVKSTVSSKALTKAPSEVQTQVSRAPPSEVKSSTSRSAAPSQAHAPVREASGDVIDTIVSEVRSATNVARNLVQSVSNAQPSQPLLSGHTDGNTIVGTLLGVAAGAALHYAFTHDKDSHSRRQSGIARSMTAPVTPTYEQSYPQLANAPQYIALEDNDYASTVRPARRPSISRHSSGGPPRVYATPFGNPSPSTASKASQAPSQRPKLLEAPIAYPPPPPTSSSSKPTPARSTTFQRPSLARTATAPTTVTKSHHSMHRTSSTTYPAQSAAGAPAPPTVVIAPLSEANLKRATATTTTTVSSITNAPPSLLYSSNKDPDVYPIQSGGGGRSRSRSSRTTVVAASKAGGASRSERRMEEEVRPEDSISQISYATAKSGRSRR